MKDIRPVDKHAGIIWRRPADEALISNLRASCWSLPKLPSDQQVMPKVWTLITLCPSHDHQVSFEDIFFFHFMENNLISLTLILRFCVLLWFSNVLEKKRFFIYRWWIMLCSSHMVLHFGYLWEFQYIVNKLRLIHWYISDIKIELIVDILALCMK